MKYQYPIIFPQRNANESNAVWRERAIKEFDAHLDRIQEYETTNAGTNGISVKPGEPWDQWRKRMHAQFIKEFNYITHYEETTKETNPADQGRSGS